MRNLLILNYEYPPLGGGAGVVSRYHAEYLAKFGYKVTVVTTWFEGENEISETENLTIIKLKSKRKVKHKSTPDEWLSWIAMSKKFLSKYLKTNTIDYCMAHFALPGGEVARFIQKRFKIPYSVVSHGQDIPWFFRQQMFKYHVFTYFWIKRICTKADKLILLTEAMKQNADRFMGAQKNKNCIVPNGCDTSVFKPDFSKKSSKFKILFIGRLVEQKDPMTFLKTIKILSTKISAKDIEIKILGDGPMRAKMESFCLENQLTEILNFSGWVSKSEMLEEYQSSHLQIITSKAEAMSIAALEGFSAGLFVLSTPVSGNTDVISEGVNGEFIPFSNAEVLAESILNFYQTKFSNNYSVPSDFLENFRKKYDWTEVVKKLISEINSSI